MKPALITQDILYDKLNAIEQMLRRAKQKRMFEGLLVNDIVKDLKVSAEFVINEWIETGKLKAINVGGKERVRGGWRISLHDYIEFLENMNNNQTPDEEKVIFLKSPEQIIRDFQKERGLLKERKWKSAS